MIIIMMMVMMMIAFKGTVRDFLRSSHCAANCPQHVRSSCKGTTTENVLLVGCLASQQQASVSQGRICSDNFTCCHTEIEVADQTFYLTQSQYTDTGPTSPSADPITPGAWQGSPLECQFLSHWYDSTPKKSRRRRDSNLGSSTLEADALTTRPTRRPTTEEQALRQPGELRTAAFVRATGILV